MIKGTTVYRCKFCDQKFMGLEGYDLSDESSMLVVNRIGALGLDFDHIPLYEKHRCSDHKIGVGEFVGFTVSELEEN